MAYEIHSSNRTVEYKPHKLLGIQEFLQGPRMPTRTVQNVPKNKILRLVRRQYDRQKKLQKEEAASTYNNADQLFLQLHLCVSFLGTYRLDIFGNNSFLTIDREDHSFPPAPIGRYSNGEHVAEVDNAETLKAIIMPIAEMRGCALHSNAQEPVLRLFALIHCPLASQELRLGSL